MAVKPPSTGSAMPVTKEASGETSHSAAAAHSSGVPRRPIGWAAREGRAFNFPSQHAVDFLAGVGGEQLREIPAGVTEQDVEAAVALEAEVDHPLVVGAAARVGTDEAGRAARLHDRARHGGSLGVLYVRQHDAGALPREAEGAGPAGARAGARHDGRLLLKEHVSGRHATAGAPSRARRCQALPRRRLPGNVAGSGPIPRPRVYRWR